MGKASKGNDQRMYPWENKDNAENLVIFSFAGI